MARYKRYFGGGSKKITIAQQANLIIAKYKDAKIKYLKGKTMIVECEIQPQPLCKKYKLKIKYNLSERPKVTVVEPKLKKSIETKLQHVFAGDELCLFRYKYREWNSTMAIVDTIIPWTSLWLFYHEIWETTGEWFGGGEHPANDEKKTEAG